jgi:SAM-dependent methyltransferase
MNRLASNADVDPWTPPDGLPLPPPELHYLVSGNSELDARSFWQIGRGCVAMISGLLSSHGVRLEGLDAILDFGCGCGRMTRHFHAFGKTRIFGTDYNATLIEWCRRNLPFAQFAVNQLRPPLDYGDGTFDLVYAFSVFTHLPEPLQSPWLADLTRVLRPGGHLVMTTHGESVARELLPDSEKKRFTSGLLVVVSAELAVRNDCNAYHPVEYVTGTLAKGLEVLELQPGSGVDAERRIVSQDVYLFRKPM